MASRHIQAKAPISTHPAFPAIVAAWFGSLLGIGSLIVPASLFEHAAAISSLTAIVPAAEAPLGSTARLMIAVTLALIGSLAGMQLARHLAASHSAPAESRRRGAQLLKNKVPISALDELGAASFDQPVEVILPALLVPGEAGAPDQDALDQEYRAPLQTGLEPAGEEDTDEEGLDQLVRTSDDAPVDEFCEAPHACPAGDAGITAEDLIRRPLDELGIVQLVERLALSLQQRPASAFHKAAPGDLEDTPSEDTAEAALEPSTVDAPASYPAELPAALRPVDFSLTSDDWASDDEEGEDEVFSSLLALRRTTAEPRKSVTLPSDDDCDIADSVAVFPDQGGTRAYRFDAPFGATPDSAPTCSPSGGNETEQTLRGALEQLRRISGTG